MCYTYFFLIKTNNLSDKYKLGLLVESDAWKHLLGRHLTVAYKEKLSEMVDYINTQNKILNKKISNLDDVRYYVNTIFFIKVESYKYMQFTMISSNQFYYFLHCISVVLIFFQSGITLSQANYGKKAKWKLIKYGT